MPASFQSFSAASATTGGDPVVTKPSGTVDGDLLIAYGIATAGHTITAPGGWNPHAASVGVNGPLWWKIASGEPADYTFVVTGGLGNAQVIIVRVTGHDSVAPIDDADGFAGTGTLVIPEVTSGGANRLLLQMVAKNGNTTFTGPGSQVERWDALTAPNNFTSAGGDETVGAGATGSRTWTPAGGGTPGIGYMLAIAPLSLGAAVTVPAAATATAEAKVPTIAAGSGVAAVPATATAAGQAPAVSAGATIAPPPAEATASSPFGGITASGGATITPPPATATADPGVPSVSAGATIATPQAEATASAIAPGLSAGASVAAVPATATASANPGDGVVETTSYFDPPTQDQSMPDHFWGRFSIPVGISVIKINGHYVNVPTPTHDELSGTEGTDWFRGGYHYAVTAQVAEDLTDDGYTLTKDAHVH